MSCHTANNEDKAQDTMVGVGLRHPHYQAALLGSSAIDFVEIHAENFFAEGGILPELLADIARLYPVSLHSTSMGLGSAVGINRDYLLRLKRLSRQINPILISDHACFSWSHFKGKAVHAGDLLPLEFTYESLKTMAENVDQVQQLLGRKILVENLSAYIEFSYSHMSEVEFLGELVELTGCGLLVDLNNLLVNAYNFSNDRQQTALQTAQQWVKHIPLNAIGEIHLAGYTPATEGNLIIDDHSQPVSEECWALYRSTLQLTGPVTTLIEWDNELPTWQTLVAQAEQARSFLERYSQTEEVLAHAI